MSRRPSKKAFVLNAPGPSSTLWMIVSGCKLFKRSTHNIKTIFLQTQRQSQRKHSQRDSASLRPIEIHGHQGRMFRRRTAAKSPSSPLAKSVRVSPETQDKWLWVTASYPSQRSQKQRSRNSKAPKKQIESIDDWPTVVVGPNLRNSFATSSYFALRISSLHFHQDITNQARLSR